MGVGNMMFVMLLGVAVVVSATGVVYAKYVSRRHYVEMTPGQAQRNAPDVE